MLLNRPRQYFNISSMQYAYAYLSQKKTEEKKEKSKTYKQERQPT